jgi:hypothetical protein
MKAWMVDDLMERQRAIHGVRAKEEHQQTNDPKMAHDDDKGRRPKDNANGRRVGVCHL